MDENNLTRTQAKNPNRVRAGKETAARKAAGAKVIKQAAQDVVKPKRGQPTKFTPELWNRVLEAVVTYQDLIEICSQPDMPSTVTIYHWMNNDPKLEDEMRRAWHMFSMIGMSVNRNILRGGILSSGDTRRDIEMANDNRWHMSRTNRRDFGDKTVVQVETFEPFVLEGWMIPPAQIVDATDSGEDDPV